MLNYIWCALFHRHKLQPVRRYHPSMSGHSSLQGVEQGYRAYWCNRCHAARYVPEAQ